MLCPKCNSPMITLFTSAVCDHCEGGKNYTYYLHTSVDEDLGNYTWYTDLLFSKNDFEWRYDDDILIEVTCEREIPNLEDVVIALTENFQRRSSHKNIDVYVLKEIRRHRKS